MSTTGIDLPETQLAATARRFHSALSRLRARVRLGLAVEGLAFCLLVFAVYFALTLPVDRWFRLEVAVRAVLLGGTGIWALWRVARRVLAPLAFKLDDDELALAVERSDTELGQKLISAVQFHRRLASREPTSDSPALMGAVVAEVPAVLDSVDLGRAIQRERMRRSWTVLLACAFFLGAAGSLYPGFGLWARRNLLLSSVDWPRATLLTVRGAADGTIVVPRGDDFTIEVDAKGVLPESVRIDYEFADGTRGRESMTQNVGEARFTYTFPGLMDPVIFYAWGGDGETSEVAVRLVDRPSLVAQRIELLYPSYMRRDGQEVAAEATEVIVPRGTVLHVTGRAQKKLARAELAIGETQVVPAAVTGGGFGVDGRITPAQSGLFHVKMRDTDGLDEGEGRRLLLHVVPDRAPHLVAKVRGIGSWITPKARIPVDLTVTDDFGLQAVKLYWGVGDNAAIGSSRELAKTFAEAEAEGLETFAAGATVFERVVRYDLMPLLRKPDEPGDAANPVRPGRFVSIRFKAWDNNEGGDDAGQWATSDSYTFKVVTDSELLRELNRRQTELRAQFEKLLARERADRAEFRELADPSTPGAIGARIRGRLSHLARQQRALAKRVLEVGRRYGQILDEMVNNRVTEGVGGAGRVRALRSVIVEGLQELGTSTMPALGKTVATWGRRREAGLRPLAESGYDRVVRQMERILKEMLKLESFTEILTKLKDLIRLEGKTAEKTRKRYEQDLENLFPGRGKKKKKNGG